eukprot:TRINITY_DN3973_c0_g2_i2.p1 TRINITY_DN3973_c0_g2~~TRINITY_DN3973_c0_g2_i2.p1  ORF type:complete len:402 (+),score=61.60 TRINITY_DN3973_c0_g2_i2:150-1355(+)
MALLRTLVALAGCIATAQAASCSFTNTHPSSTGAYVTLVDNSGVVKATSETVSFGSTAYFSCDSGELRFMFAYNASGTLIAAASTSSFACQALNLMSLEPTSYGSSGHKIDMSVSTTGEISSGYIRTFFLNTGYDGAVVWKFKERTATAWTTVATTSNFKDGLVSDSQYSSDIEVIYQAETASGSVIATSSAYTITSSDVEMASSVNLIGSLGSEQLIHVRACGTLGSNCNACDSGLDLLLVLAVTSVVVVVAFLGALYYWICCRRTSGCVAPSSEPPDIESADFRVPTFHTNPVPYASQPGYSDVISDKQELIKKLEDQYSSFNVKAPPEALNWKDKEIEEYFESESDGGTPPPSEPCSRSSDTSSDEELPPQPPNPHPLAVSVSSSVGSEEASLDTEVA